MEGQQGADGCRIAPKISAGTVFTDVRGGQWVVGRPIGAGAFGAIYSADRKISKNAVSEYVMKIEPHLNGPLFVELHALLRIRREEGENESQPAWTGQNPSKPPGWVGIPNFFGFGSGVVAGERVRFVVMSRLGADIQKFFQSGERPLALTTAFNIAIQIIDTLEFIHSRHYCHNDIKAQNILLGPGQDHNSVYLVDFGLAYKYKDDYGHHIESWPDERKAHDGTLEYTSRDAHTGAHSRRGDLETLGYNLIHWISGYLPWLGQEDPVHVQAQKVGFMENIRGLLKKCFKPEPWPEVLESFLEYVKSMEFNTDPDYTKLRKMLGEAMRKEGVEPYSKLVFTSKKKHRRVRRSSTVGDKNTFSPVEEETRHTRSQDDETRTEPWSWEDVLWSDPEAIIRQASRSYDETDSTNPEKEAAFEERQRLSLLRPTPEMQRILAKRAEQELRRQSLSWKEQLAEFNQRNAAAKTKFLNMDLKPSYLTPAMEEVIAIRAKRLASGASSPITPEPSDDESTEPEYTRTRRHKSGSLKESSQASSRCQSRAGSLKSRFSSFEETLPLPGRRVSTRSRTASRSDTPSSLSDLTVTTSCSNSRASSVGARSPRAEQPEEMAAPTAMAFGGKKRGIRKTNPRHVSSVLEISDKSRSLLPPPPPRPNLRRLKEVNHSDMKIGRGRRRALEEEEVSSDCGAKQGLRGHNTPLPDQEQEILPGRRLRGEAAVAMVTGPLGTPKRSAASRLEALNVGRTKLQLSPPPGVSTRSQPVGAGVLVHVSTESPAKIRNRGSPVCPSNSLQAVVRSAICRGLNL